MLNEAGDPIPPLPTFLLEELIVGTSKTSFETL
jgi:hypothetical protein